MTIAEGMTEWRWHASLGHLAAWVTLLLVIILAFSLARLTWMLVDRDPVAPVLPAPEAPLSGASNGLHAPVAVLNTVAALHLFGKADPGGQRVALDTMDSPETRLQLKLHGVVAALPSGQGIAFIASETGEERHYTPGTELPGGATLEQVLEDRVILHRDGRYEQLRLPKDAPPTAAVRPVPADPAVGRRPGASRSGVLPEDLRRQWLDEPAALFSTVQVQPVMRDGAIHGFAIAPRRDARLFRELGLRPGDVVTGVNGVIVAGMSDPSAIRDQLRGASELRLDIERNGQPETVVVPIGN